MRDRMKVTPQNQSYELLSVSAQNPQSLCQILRQAGTITAGHRQLGGADAGKGEPDTKMTIEEANHYINFCINEGYDTPEELEGWSDEKRIEWVEKTMAKADLAYDAWKEQNDNS